MKCNMWLLKVTFFGFIAYVDCTCVLPMVDGTWLTSSRGTWTVNNNGTVIEEFETSLSVTHPTSNLTCHSQTQAGYLLETTIQAFSDIVISVYTCLDIRTTVSSPSKYIFHFVTATDSGTGERFTSNMSQACINDNYTTAINSHIILKQGSEANATATTLPNVIRGNYSVNYTDVDGVTVTGSDMDACSYVTMMSFNNSDSGRTLAFSSSGLLKCMYSDQEGDLIYVFTYNSDSSVDDTSTYSFACWVFSYSTNGVVATVFPRACQSSQNATSVPSGGQTFIFTPYSVCTAEEDAAATGLSTAVIIAIAIVCSLVVVFALVAIIFFLKHKGQPKEETPEKQTKTIKAERFTTVNESHMRNSETNPSNRLKSTATLSDRPMTRWSKATHRMSVRREKTVIDSKAIAHDTTSSGNTEGQIMIRKTYVSMAPTSVLFTDANKVNTISPKLTSAAKPDVSQTGMKRAKTMIETSPRKSKRSVIYRQRSRIIRSDVTKNRLDTLRILRTRTFHDFSRDFDKLHAFPMETGEAPVSIGNASILSNNETMKDSTKPVETANDTTNGKPTQAVTTVKSRPSTLNSRPSTTDGVMEKPAKPKTPAKRTRSETTSLSRSLVGFSYNSPYALTQSQKQYVAERNTWIRNMKQKDIVDERLLSEQRTQDNTAAYKTWLKNKAARTQQLKRYFVMRRKPRPKPEQNNEINGIANHLSADNQISAKLNVVSNKH